MRVRAWTAMLLLVAVLLVAGCARSTSNDDYGRDLRAAMDEVEQSVGGASADPEKTRIALAEIAERLDAIDPPDDLRANHEQLVDGVRDMSGAIRALTEARTIAQSNPTRAEALTKQFAQDDSFQRVEQAVAAIREAGVDVNL